MSKQLGEVIAGIRATNALTMLEIALKCDLSEAVVWKLENNRPVRWETVHTIVSVAFNIQPHEAIYQTIHHLWLGQRNEKAKEISPALNKQLLSKHGVEACRKFRILIRDLDPAQTKEALMGAEKAMLLKK